jgi:hypothetical protein
VIWLGDEDANYIKSVRDFAIGRENTFVSLTSQMIVDMNGNEANEIAVSTALGEADCHVSDDRRPEIVQFDLNMNSDTITIVFNEAADVETFEPTEIRLQNSASGPTVTYTLTGHSSVSQPHPVVVVVGLTLLDSNRIKALRNLGTQCMIQ